jgi:hypothetical protein
VSAATTDVEDEVHACFRAYEDALLARDVAAMDAWFADDHRTIRFGTAEEQWGADAVRRWRSLAPQIPAGRSLSETRVDVWTDTVAVVTTLFRYPSSVLVGRQSQTWLRTEAGWRIIHAHVSERPLTP